MEDNGNRCDFVKFGRIVPTSQSKALFPSSGYVKTTWLKISEDLSLQFGCHTLECCNILLNGCSFRFETFSDVTENTVKMKTALSNASYI